LTRISWVVSQIGKEVGRRKKSSGEKKKKKKLLKEDAPFTAHRGDLFFVLFVVVFNEPAIGALTSISFYSTNE
jgi:ascorbate-specific PTS system EIIC-type component UlaA